MASAALTGCSAPKVDMQARLRSETALAMWQERCKKSGLFIYRTADNVESI